MYNATAHLSGMTRTRADIAAVLAKITNPEVLNEILAATQAAYEADPTPRPRNEESIDTLAGLAAYCAYRVKDETVVRKAAILLANAYDKQLDAEKSGN